MTIKGRFPTYEDLLRSEPDDLGAEIVLYLQQQHRNKPFYPGNFSTDLMHMYGRQDVEPNLLGVLAEAISWASGLMLVVPEYRRDGSIRLSRKGHAFTRSQITAYRLQQIMPEFMLHPDIREGCLAIFNTGKYQAAVFEAFKLLEIAIRDASGQPSGSYGKDMIFAAFNIDRGTLTDFTALKGEREAVRELMTGAHGLFKNPRSHRNVELEDPIEAAEMLVIASHLMRIVMARKAVVPNC